MKPTREVIIGRHEVSIYENNLVLVTWRGDVSDEEAREARDVYVEISRAARSTWVTDLSRLGKMSSRARLLLSVRDVQRPTPRRFDLIYVGANLRTKIVMQIVTHAGAIASVDQFKTFFFETVEEAMAFARERALS